MRYGKSASASVAVGALDRGAAAGLGFVQKLAVAQAIGEASLEDVEGFGGGGSVRHLAGPKIKPAHYTAPQRERPGRPPIRPQTLGMRDRVCDCAPVTAGP